MRWCNTRQESLITFFCTESSYKDLFSQCEKWLFVTAAPRKYSCSNQVLGVSYWNDPPLAEMLTGGPQWQGNAEPIGSQDKGVIRGLQHSPKCSPTDLTSWPSDPHLASAVHKRKNKVHCQFTDIQAKTWTLGFCLRPLLPLDFPGGSDGKASACNAGDPGLIPGSGRSPGEENGNPLQYSCLENPMDRGAW